MDLQDQASSLREKVSDVANPPLHSHEVDIMNLPPRSEKHSRSRAQQKKKISQGKLHLWITRGIVISFLGFEHGSRNEERHSPSNQYHQMKKHSGERMYTAFPPSIVLNRRESKWMVYSIGSLNNISFQK